MTTIQETPNHLIIKSFARRRRLIIGLIQLRTLIADELTQPPLPTQSEQASTSGEVVYFYGSTGD